MKQIVEFLESLVIIALVLVGISGLSFNVFRDDGWLEKLLGNIWELDTQYILISIPVLIGAVLMFRKFRGGKAFHSKTSRLPNLLLYGMMLAGVYFIGLYVWTGAFY